MTLINKMLIEFRIKYNQETRKFKKKFALLRKANPELNYEEVHKTATWIYRVNELKRAIEILEGIGQ